MRAGVCPSRSLWLLNSFTSFVIEETSEFHASSVPGTCFLGRFVPSTSVRFSLRLAVAAARSFSMLTNISSIHCIWFYSLTKQRHANDRVVLHKQARMAVRDGDQLRSPDLLRSNLIGIHPMFIL